MKKLETLINAGKRLLVTSAIAGISVLFSGCSMQAPIKRFDHNQSRTFYSDISPRGTIAVGYTQPNLTPNQLYVPVHNDDGGPIYGGEYLDINNSLNLGDRDFLFLQAGIEGSIGNKYLRPKIGIDIQYTPDTYPDVRDGYPKQSDNRDHLSSIVRQRNGLGLESYAWGQFRHNEDICFEPFIGLDIFLFRKILLGIETGIPHASFSLEKGHWRYNQFETSEYSKWTGFGRSLSASIGYTPDKDSERIYFGISGAMEEYDVRLFGEKNKIKNLIGPIFLMKAGF